MVIIKTKETLEKGFLLLVNGRPAIYEFRLYEVIILLSGWLSRHIVHTIINP